MRAVTAIAVSLIVMAAAAPLMSADVGGVIVQEKQGTYRVTARFVVPQSPALVLRVLTDYEQIPKFMPDVKTSIVRSRSDGRAIVEQEAQARVLLFSKRLHLLLDVHETTDALTFVDMSGQSFATYAGSWHVTAAEGQTTVSYQLVARPAFDVPQFVLMRVLRKDSTEMIERLRNEFASR
jgi:ribosome-associated toxin RatA of RatAB toxin-antitoxin module